MESPQMCFQGKVLTHRAMVAGGGMCQRQAEIMKIALHVAELQLQTSELQEVACALIKLHTAADMLVRTLH